MIKREVIDTVGLLNEDLRLIAVEDYNYWARIIHPFKPYYIDDVLMKYRWGQGHVGISPTNVNDKVFKELYLIKSKRNSVGINPLILCIKVAKIFFNPILKLFHLPLIGNCDDPSDKETCFMIKILKCSFLIKRNVTFQRLKYLFN